ncbi:hypothetical protein EMIHUDRAFT_373591 [Emiliania huxleyi CCMP1516]|uniref:Protein kinase domain-containing protein n=2 Tax=Emiliania huxleyi TaxID=2903 RepID=A0A0D3K1P8_EMIH1|nr:hypothetical protein EMIHUDRAFT_373591 [Emiliania huxleyi CCMP1516]EOD29683.1 hypothetical protein EMIHUDRAFT_373591 [Emiliania huxleyi CCMP1516]|eukprot:XP_005782112.1 hypothetical protein EMIHUDRAFT_373591 [Emiliania huxleyi CCMP1516]
MLTLGAPLGAPGKDKIVHRGVDENGRQWAVAQLKRLGAGAVRKLTAEVSFLRRAAAAGLAPQVSTELSDLPKGRLVTELCDGGTLKDVLRRQDGALRRDQQQRLVEILEALGGPTRDGDGAASRVAGCGEEGGDAPREGGRGALMSGWPAATPTGSGWSVVLL